MQEPLSDWFHKGQGSQRTFGHAVMESSKITLIDVAQSPAPPGRLDTRWTMAKP